MEWTEPSPSFETRCYARRRVFDSGSWESEHDLVTPEAVSAGLERPEGTTVVFTEDICDTAAGLAIDAAGRAVALFIHNRSLDFDAGGGQLWWSGMRAMFDPESGWREPEWIGQNAPCCAEYEAAMNGPGRAAASWSRDGQLWASAYEPEGGWHDALLVTDNRPDYVILDGLVLDDGGDGLAIFRVPGRSLYEPRLYASRLRDSAWQPPVAVDDEDFSVTPTTFDIAMNGGGVALLAWRRCISDDECEIRARRFDPASGWDAPVTVGQTGTRGDGYYQEVQVAIDALGNGLLVFVESRPDPEGALHPDTGEVLRYQTVHAARFREGEWSSPEPLHTGELGDGRQNPRIAIDAAGNALVAWFSYRYWYQEAPWDPESELVAQTFSPDAGFGSRETLESLVPSTSVTPLDLAMNAAGVGVAAWGRDDHGHVRVFR